MHGRGLISSAAGAPRAEQPRCRARSGAGLAVSAARGQTGGARGGAAVPPSGARPPPAAADDVRPPLTLRTRIAQQRSGREPSIHGDSAMSYTCSVTPQSKQTLRHEAGVAQY